MLYHVIQSIFFQMRRLLKSSYGNPTHYFALVIIFIINETQNKTQQNIKQLCVTGVKQPGCRNIIINLPKLSF